ncbi:hypothetical protein AZA_71928 [Nitrospirillum viridazoti Y2]|uniref:Uncharacterized protein n=1 Tax=Nitrospirillum amazonense TaxID=28077 RepID=A0A560HMR5_9PROT|nr:hypothetical protein [Nitrospirillum amazonense]EGY00322.1 hypothetical protein AZA_71928 [Nitrospirillum amazonense Y2]TWB47823.1 hypothetical protein FBZ92_13279 [Nitrospirillum amazonense]
MKAKVVVVVMIALTSMSTASADTLVNSQSPRISDLWNLTGGDSVGVKLSGATFDGGCGGGKDMFATDPNDASNKLMQSLLLSAYLANRGVQVFVNGCVAGVSKIVAVHVMPN